MYPTPFGDFAVPLTPRVDPVDATARPVTPIPPVEKDLPNTPWLSPDAPFASPATPAGSAVVEVATPLIPADPSPVARPPEHDLLHRGRLAGRHTGSELICPNTWRGPGMFSPEGNSNVSSFP